MNETYEEIAARMRGILDIEPSELNGNDIQDIARAILIILPDLDEVAQVALRLAVGMQPAVPIFKNRIPPAP